MSNKNIKYSELENDWANNVKGAPIHISQAESGAKGYYCMSCDKDMQAVKRKKQEYKSYFRHHVKDLDKSKTECVYASRVYREKLAFFYFLRTKQITVPDVYKYPPEDVEGFPNLLKEKETIFAHKVEKEVTFFEDENGIIHWGNDVKVEDRYLWVRPDAVFFDKEGKPILFIEFVVTHKPDIDKLNKLQRLGINTVQIIVPKLPEAELEKEISKVSKVKWTYNEIESNTKYVPTSSGNTEGIPLFDEEQRKLFIEAYNCRTTQIGNLVRKINKCLESQSYRRAEQLFEQEIQRIEKATREHQSRLDEIQDGIEIEISSEFRERREKLNERNRRFQSDKGDLERRYYSKRNLLRKEQEDTDREIEFRYRVGKSEEEIRSEFEFEERIVEEDERRIRSFIESDKSFERKFDDEERSIDEEFERLRSEITERIRTRNFEGDDELSRRVKKSIRIWEYIRDFEEKKRLYERYRNYQEVIRSGTWKKW